MSPYQRAAHLRWLVSAPKDEVGDGGGDETATGDPLGFFATIPTATAVTGGFALKLGQRVVCSLVLAARLQVWGSCVVRQFILVARLEVRALPAPLVAAGIAELVFMAPHRGLGNPYTTNASTRSTKAIVAGIH